MLHLLKYTLCISLLNTKSVWYQRQPTLFLSIHYSDFLIRINLRQWSCLPPWVWPLVYCGLTLIQFPLAFNKIGEIMVLTKENFVKNWGIAPWEDDSRNSFTFINKGHWAMLNFRYIVQIIWAEYLKSLKPELLFTYKFTISSSWSHS